MRILLALVLSVFLLGCEGKVDVGISFYNLDNRNQTFYVKGSETPYTGKAHMKYPSGVTRAIFNYKNGRMDGVQLGWQEDGVKAGEVTFKDGEKIQGSQKYWKYGKRVDEDGNEL